MDVYSRASMQPTAEWDTERSKIWIGLTSDAWGSVDFEEAEQMYASLGEALAEARRQRQCAALANTEGQ